MDLLRSILRDVVAELDARDAAAASAGLRSRAARFLEKLDPDSQEGMWFEAFAEGYADRMAAAMAYVRGMNEP